MKKFYPLFLVLVLSFFTQIYSQCAFNNTLYTNVTPPCPGTSTVNCIFGGEYVSVNVIAGNTYTFSTCGSATFDSQLTLYNAAGTTVLGYSDDACGTQSTITWVATYTGVANILLDEFNCTSNATCMNMDITCTPPVGGGTGCNTNTTICTAGVAGPFGFGPPGGDPGDCLDWFASSQYAYIILYVTQSGPLEMLIQGNNTSGASNFFDVSIYDIPPGANPCSSLTAANLIGCNYASSTGGCNQFGTFFGCASNVPSPNVVAGDVLMIIVEDWQNGPSTTFTLDLGPPPAAQTGPPDGTVNPAGPFCVSAAAVQLTAANIGGTWSGPGVSPTGVFDPAAAGVGTHTINYNIGTAPCVGAGSTNITVFNTPPAAASNTGPYCVGQTISLNTTTVVGATYSWAGPGGYVGAGQSPTRPGATVAMGGVYTVTVTAGGCSATSTTTVVVNPAPIATATNGGPYCAGQTIQLNSVGGSATDDWAGPGFTATDTQNPTRPSSTVAMGGVYTVTVTSGGCSSTSTTTVVVNPIPIATATNGGPYCAGQTIQLNSVGGSATDDWAGPGFTATDTQNPTRPSSTVAMGGVYTVTVTAGGCSSTSTTTVVVNPIPTATATNGGPYCAGQTIQLNSVGGSATDDWAGPGFTATDTQNPTRPSSTVAMGGVYTVTVTAGGCSSTSTTTVVVNPIPIATATNGGPYCAGQTIQLNSVGGSATDDWAGPGYTATDTQNPTRPSSTVAMGGVYTVTVTAGGCSSTSTTTVVVNPIPTATATNGGPYCAGQTIQLNSVGGGATDDWAGPGFTATDTQNPTRPSSTVAMGGVYTVTVTAGGCSSTSTTTVVVNPIPTATATNGGPYCAGQTIQLNSVGGGATDDWAGPGFTATDTQNPTRPSSTVAMSGIYTVTLTSAAGCTSTSTTTVVVNALPTPLATNTGPYCPGQTIQLNSPTGSATDDWTGPGAYTQNNQQNPTIPGAASINDGIYTVTVTDINGCSATATTTVVVNTGASAVANNSGPYCEGATINLTSPAGPIDWDWVGPGGYTASNTQNPTRPASTVLMGGVYTVTVTMAGGCTGTGTTTVVVNPLPTPTATNTGPYCSGATIQLNSPTGSATDDWAGPGAYSQNDLQNPTRPTSTVAMSGIYTVTVTDGNGCSATATTTVVVNGPPTPTANNTGPYCAGATIQLNSPTGSATDDWTGPLVYTQNDTQNPTIASGTVAMSGVYTVTVTDVNGCFATATTTVIVNALPIPTANNTGPYCIGATIQLNSPTGSATDDWTGPPAYVQNNMQNPTIGSATAAMDGVYTVSVTDANGCNATATTTVVINALPTPLANNTGPYCDGASMDLSSSGGVDYDWTGPNGFVLANTQNGTILGVDPTMSGAYTVTVTDANGCVSTTNTVVTINGLPIVVANNNSPVCEFQDVNLTSGGGVSYDWTGPGGYNTLNTQNPTIVAASMAAAGVYTVTVTDGNSCVATATTTVVINSNLVFTAASNSAICEGTQLDLTAQSIGGASYNWAGPNGFVALNQQNPSIANATALATGTYTVLATNAAGCTGTATVNVLVNPLPTALFAGDNLSGCAPICVNFSDLSVGNGGVITSWDWNVESQNPSTNQNETFCFNNTGTYDAALTVITADGCSSTLSLLNYITVYSNPVAEFMYTPQEIDESDPQVIFASTSTGATVWDWSFGDGGASVLENPTHNYSDTGTYCILLTVSNQYGCSDTAAGCLYIAPVYSLFIPNAFTVNEDGLNETFNVYGRGIQSIIVRIFDRWGEEIYFFDDINKGWPGTKQNGLPCKQDVYVYRIEVVDGKNDLHEYMGSITLIR